MIKQLRKVINKFGIDIKRFPQAGPIQNRMKLLNTYNIDLVFDVGANIGQYAEVLRKYGYQGKIVSFEPLNSAYEQLSAKCKKDRLWKAEKTALGDFTGKSQINIAGNSFSSSMLDMLPDHLKAAPASGYIGTQEIAVEKLDNLYNKYYTGHEQIFLKIDTQGFEMQVLKGAEEALQYIKGIQVEMSLVPLYKDDVLFKDMVKYLNSKGFELMSLEPGFNDSKSGRMLQMDGIFYKI
jgi:FkbM family methyltransferase